ncbi:MAG: SUMF1/EgtB/PvdO family nonheme iron enzyme [Succinivibrio sp.]|nr:SUMF1/EgtB/PvdO family nonheme iron enzyme [Succinivibrio sp.]
MKKYLVSLLCLATTFAYAEDVDKIFNPKPLPDDVVISTPCNGKMVFRKVYTTKENNKVKDKTFSAGAIGTLSPMAQNPNTRHIQGSFYDKGGYYYLISKYELMQGQYDAIVNAKQCKNFNKIARLPKVNLSYFEAINAANAYSLYLQTATDAIKQNNQVAYARLATDEEWEFAARGGLSVTQSEFEADLPPVKNNDIDNYAWYQGANSANGRLQLVGLKEPNPLGLFDMLGNAQEIVLEPFKAVRTGRLLGISGGMTVRGGSFMSVKSNLTNATRSEKNFYLNKGELKAKDTGTRFVLGLPTVTSIDEAKKLNAQIDALADGGDSSSDDNALKGASTKLKKVTEESKKAQEEFKKQKALLEKKNQDLDSEKSSLEDKASRLLEFNQDLSKLNDKLSKSNQELTNQLSSLKDGIEKANAKRQQMTDVAVTANLRLGGFLCKSITDEYEGVRYFSKILEVSKKQCDKDPKRCSYYNTFKQRVANKEQTLHIAVTYYGDTMANAVENYSIEEFKSQLENSKATFGKDVDYDKFVDLYFKHLQEYKKLSKDLKKNQQHWIETCNKLVK